MKQFPEDLQGHLDGESTTLCRCWILRRTDGVVLGFTDHDYDIILDGTLCEGSGGMEADSIEERLGLNIDSTQVSGALSSDFISEAEIARGCFDNARVESYVVNWADPGQFFLDRIMLVGEIAREDSHYRLELRGRMAELDQTVGNHFVKRCQANLGDAKCGVSLLDAQFLAQGQITRAISADLYVVTGLEAFESGWFTGGRFVPDELPNGHAGVEICEHRTSGGQTTLRLWEPLTFDAVTGAAFSVTAGCDKEFNTCRHKFTNTVNFRGFPHLPGNDFVLGRGADAGPSDGSPLVP